MNILIIGNGFDLAHGLPTQYKDFLKFVNVVNAIFDKKSYEEIVTKETEKITDEDEREKEIEKTKDFFDFINSLNNQENFKYIEDLHKLSSNNLWFDYFNLRLKDNVLFLKENWIDFECEISKVIIFLDELDKKKNSFASVNNDKFLLEEPYFYIDDNEFAVLAKTCDSFLTRNRKDIDFSGDNLYTISISLFEEIKKVLLLDLNKLTRCLEIYLSLYINSLDINVRIPEILELKDDIDCVLSFNYTNTFERLYAQPETHEVLYDYIHGKANIENTVKSCKLVLGIDEYLDEEERNKNIEFIQYKKYFQRVYKKTGCQYLNWLSNVHAKNNAPRTLGSRIETLNIFIVGHSLDITDKDILKNIIMFDKQKEIGQITTPVKVTIFDHNQRASATHIANLVRVITQDELIDSVYIKDGNNPKIVFKDQSKSININNTENK